MVAADAGEGAMTITYHRDNGDSTARRAGLCGKTTIRRNNMADLCGIELYGDDFILHLPNSRRTLSVPANAYGIAYIKKILTEARQGFTRQPSAYLRNYPTQHVIEKWIKSDHARKEYEERDQLAQQRAELEEANGIKINSLKINI